MQVLQKQYIISDDDIEISGDNVNRGDIPKK
jgi:hypothetical protein